MCIFIRIFAYEYSLFIDFRRKHLLKRVKNDGKHPAEQTKNQEPR